MENIERTQFVVLTGHLDDQPLPDLIRRLRVQRKSGRLQVEYPDAPGSFFFEDGQLVDARLGTLRGVEALYAALSLDGASFNFNPLVRPPERNIDRQEQQFIRDLVEAPRCEALTEIKVAGVEPDTSMAIGSSLPRNAPRQQLPPAAAELMAPLEERLTAVEEAIISTSHRFSRERLIYGVIIGFLAGLSLVTILHVIFDPFRSAPAPATTRSLPAAASNVTAGGADATRASSGGVVNKAQEVSAPPPVGGERGGLSQPSNLTKPAEAAPEQARPRVTTAVVAAAASGVQEPVSSNSSARRSYTVQVLVEVKNGRVTAARVWKPRPGASEYEAAALKLAKERRYPNGFTGGERLKIRVKP